MTLTFRFPFLVVCFCGIPFLHAQHPALLEEPFDGNLPPDPEVRYTFPPAEVLDTTVHHQGGRKIIVQQLALDPNDPVKPVRPPKASAVPDPPQSEGEPTITPPSFLLMLSATAYPGPYTHLQWTHYSVDGTNYECSGWSNVDWNHLTGITTFIATDGEPHSFVMGIGTENVPAGYVPDFKTKEPTFIPDQENIPAEALLTVDSLHKLYALEKDKLVAAHERRERVNAAREAELLAHPPQPKDLIIRYRIAETPLDETGVHTPETR